MTDKPMTLFPVRERLVPLTRGRYAIVDEADYDWLMQWRWIVSSMPIRLTTNNARD